MDVDSQSPRPRRRWGLWVALALVVLFALAILGHAYWGWYQERELEREVARLRAGGEPMVAGDFVHQPVAEAENAALLLRQAARSINEAAEAWGRAQQLQLDSGLKEDDVALVGEVVQQNQLALKLLREARGKKGVDWQIQISPLMISTLLPDVNGQTKLAALSRMSALLAHQQSDDREAVERVRDLLMLSRAAGKMDTGVIPLLVESGTSSMAASAAIEMTRDLRVGMSAGDASAEQVRLLIAELLDEAQMREGAVRAMKFERAMGVQFVTIKEALWAGQKPIGQMQEMALGVRRYVQRPAIYADARWVLRYAKANEEAMQQGMNWPSYRRAAATPRAMAGEVKARWMWHPTAGMVAANYDGMVLKQYSAMTMRRLAAVGLAVRLYAREHAGEWPGTLEELAPEYLREVPLDPMAEGAKKIGYSASGARVKLWSVGEAGKGEIVVELK